VRRLTTRLARTRIYTAMARLYRSRAGSGETGPEASAELLPEEVATLLDRSVGPEGYERDDLFHDRVLTHYRFNLGRIVAIAESAGAETILVAPASNLRDCTPFKSEHREGFGEREAVLWATELQSIARAEAAGDAPAALVAIDRALSIDGRYAELHFARGRALEALGRQSEAATAYARARDEDVCPLRAPGAVSRIVREVAAEHGIALVEFDRMAEHAAVGGIPGSDLFLDHVHPTIEGNRRLALALIDAMRARALLVTVPEWGPRVVEQVALEVEAGLDAEEHGRALRNLAKVLGWAGKLDEALLRAAQATQLAPNDPEGHYNLGLLLVRSGGDAEAEQAFARAVALRADYAEAHYDLGLLRQLRGDLDGAEESYLSAIDARPDYAEAHNNIGVVYERRGDAVRARAFYERAVELAPEYVDARENLERLN
jgi:tetratricopeptide (TPR) repeat protein